LGLKRGRARKPLLRDGPERNGGASRVRIRASGDGGSHVRDVPLSLCLSVECLGSLVAVIIHPPGQPSLALSMAGGADQCAGCAVFRIGAPPRGAAIGRVMDLFVPAGLPVPAVLPTCPCCAS